MGRVIIKWLDDEAAQLDEQINALSEDYYADLRTQLRIRQIHCLYLSNRILDFDLHVDGEEGEEPVVIKFQVDE